MIADLRYAFRMLWKTPGFTLVAILSLALGTGANSAVFSFVDALLLHPLPVVHPGEVLTITSVGKTPGDPMFNMSYREFLDFRENSKTMQDFVAVSIFRIGYSLSPGVVPKVKYGALVSGGMFQAMGVIPALGRFFRPDEDKVPGRDAVVVLGYDFWRDEFGADRNVVGRTIWINGAELTVIGVAPEQFTGLDPYFKSAMFLPAILIPRLSPGTVDPNQMIEDREYRAFGMKGRLKPGVTMPQAEAELINIAEGLAATYPATNKHRTVNLRTEVQRRIEGSPSEARLLLMIMIMGGLVLVVSCCNVASLLLSRARSRTREVAIRLAMGAGRPRLIRQLLTESLVLGVCGGLAGLAFAWVGLVLLRNFKMPSDLPFMFDFHLNQRALLFTMAAALISVVFFGLVPALQGSYVDLVPALKAGSGDSSGRRVLGRIWGRNLLVVGQVAISLVLLIVALMLYRGFHKQVLTGTGFRTSHLMMMSFDPKLVRYSDALMEDFYRRVLERASHAPGVKSAAMTDILPLSVLQRVFAFNVDPEGYLYPKGQDSIHTFVAHVNERFFDTMDIPIIAGRGFRAADMEGEEKSVIVNEVFARKYWPGRTLEDVVGKRVGVFDARHSWLEIIGVARVCKYSFITEPPADFVYFPLSWIAPRRRTLIAESFGDSASVAEPLREAVRSIDPTMPLFDVRTMEDFFETGAVSQFRIMFNMVATMGFMGLTLAMIGLYGLVSYSVTCRSREFGIRMAIGSGRLGILNIVLRQALVLAAIGIAVGLGASLPAGNTLKSLVDGANSDWTPYVMVPLMLLAVAILAAYGPARRASRIDPMKALREE